MLLYCQHSTDKDQRDLFYKYFSGSKLKRALEKIEQDLRFDEDQRALYSNARTNAYDLFTKHVHNSFAAIILGTRAPSLDDPNNYEYALFSTPSIPAIDVISSLNQQILLYLIGTLLPMLKIYHSFHAISKWDDIIALRECFARLYVFQNT